MPKPKRPRKIIDFQKLRSRFEESEGVLYKFTSQESPEQRITGLLTQNPFSNKVKILHIGTEKRNIKPGEEWTQVGWKEAKNTNSIGHLRGLYEDLKTFLPEAKGNFFGRRVTGAHYRAANKSPGLVNIPQTSWRRKKEDIKGIE